MMSQKARSGLPFEKLYNKKQCHAAFEFKHNHQTYEVQRIRGSVSRIYYIYRPNKVIIVVKILAKREDKLTDGEEAHITDRVKKIVAQLDDAEIIASVK